MKRRTLLLGALIGFSAPAIRAHGDKHADQRTAADARQAQQKDWGVVGERHAVTRTITIAMTDNMRFAPDRITVNEGDTVRFVVSNKGRMLHEMVIGTPKELQEHAALMAKYPGMEHDEPYMVHVDPGKTGEIVWNFNRAGAFEFACLIAGHYEAGMRGILTVNPKQGAPK